jgi:outer membrane receptor protein involved in Fe transport
MTMRCKLLLSVLLSLCAASAYAQFGASIQGTVVDSSGGAVVGATVTVTNPDTGISKTTVTADTGFYRVSALVPGKYTISVEAAGFKKEVTKGVFVSAEELTGHDIVLQLGAVTESVTISGDAITLNSENANVAGSISAQDIQRLPEVGRDPYELLRLAPGVLGDNARGGATNNATFLPGTEQLGGASNTGIFQTENQPQISANGQRVSSNNYEIDGVSVNSLGLGGAAVVTPSQESVKEIKVITSTYSAEDGRNSGAQIKVISQNGTNQFHGSGVVVFDDKGLNAFNKFYGPTNIPANMLTCQDNTKVFASRCPERVDTKQRLFGGSLGGPVLKDKLFFFFSYEGLRRNDTTFTNEWIETPEFRTYVHQVRPGSLADRLFSLPGALPRVVTGGLTPPSPPNGNAVQGKLGLSYDIGSINVPQGQKVGATQTFDGIPDVTYANVASPNTTSGNQYHGRADYNRGNDQLAYSGYFVPLNNFGGGPRPFMDQPFQPRNSASMATWIHIFSATLLNEARFSFTRFHDDEFSILDKASLAIPKLDTNGFNFAGGPSLGLPAGGGLQYGIDRSVPKILVENTYEFRDTVSKQLGNKFLKFGTQIIREQDNSLRRQAARPEFAFDNILSLANDAPFFENAADINPLTGGTPNSHFYFRETSYNFFVQNDWKFRKNLTLNLGLRYEYTTPISEKNGHLSNYIPGPNGIIDGHVASVSQLYDSNKKNFAPRLGFAWSPTRFNSRAVVRGGWGISYDRDFFNLFTNARFNPPFATAGIGLCCDPSGGILYAFASPSDPLTYPANPALQSGIDPVTGGLLAPTPTKLPGGFVRNDQYIEIDGSPKHVPSTYIYNYSLQIEYQALHNLFVSIGYEASTGHHLVRTIDMNRFTPGDSFNCDLQSQGCANNKDMVQEADINGNPITPRLTGNPNFDRIFFPLADVNSDFNALLVHVSKVYAHGFSIDGSYRWSKSIDTASFGRGAQQADPSQQNLDRGPSDFDVKHQFVLFGLWDLPFPKFAKGYLGKALGGWQINGVFTAHSGFPWTPQQGCCFFGTPGSAANDINGDGIGNDFPTQWDGKGGIGSSNQSFINGVFPKDTAHPNGGFDYFNIAPGGACPNFPANCITARKRGPNGIGRNRFRGPGYRQIDMTLGKHTLLPSSMHLGEAPALDLRANFFNIFNMLNLPPFQTGGQSNTDFTNSNDFGHALSGLAGRVIEFQIRLSF